MEVTGGRNLDCLSDLLTLYQHLFPQYIYYLPVMQLRAHRDPGFDSNAIEHQWVGYINNEPASITVFKYLARFNFGLGLDLGILPQFRMSKIAGDTRPLSEIITHHVISQIVTDAKDKGNANPMGLVVEVEHEQLVERYRTYGFTILPIEYHEPSFVCGYEELLDRNRPREMQFKPMRLGIFLIGNEHDLKDPATLEEIISGVYLDHYHLSPNHWTINKAIQSIQPS